MKNLCGFGEAMDSMQESFQPSLPCLERGEISMHKSMCMRDNVGKRSDHVKKVSFSDCTCSFTIFMQAMIPKRINVSCKSHGNFWATENSEFGHSLDVQREIYFHDGCFPKAPNISHTFSHSEITWENHLPHLDLMQAGDALCRFHMWDYDLPPYA